MQVEFPKLKSIILLISFLLPLTLSGCKKDSAEGSTGGDIAAKVGSVDIPLSKVDKAIERGLQGTEKKLSELSPVELASARLQVLDTLITEEALLQRAKQENIKVTDEDINNYIQKAIQTSGLSADDFQKQLKEAGMTEEDFKENQRRQLTIEKMQEKLSNVKPPSDRDIEDYYTKNQAEFMIGKGVNLSAIIIDPADNKAKNDAIGDEQAKQKIAAVYNQLRSGADFATVARIQSEDRTAYQGGDLGFLDEQSLRQGGFPGQLVQQFFEMKEGDITPPVGGSGGRYYIFKLTSKRTQEEKLTLDSPQVKAQISQLLVGQKKSILSSALRLSALDEIRIENYLAQRILQNPDNFGSLRPTSLSGGTTSKPAEPKASPEKPDEKSATAEPTDKKPDSETDDKKSDKK
ncbi:MAG: SurA N-terminal domain-containing protein [Blastocatellia bacterium]|nr:SurA N-terminal domain-containing protein [Blastocatellia bacterium]